MARAPQRRTLGVPFADLPSFVRHECSEGLRVFAGAGGHSRGSTGSRAQRPGFWSRLSLSFPLCEMWGFCWPILRPPFLHQEPVFLWLPSLGEEFAVTSATAKASANDGAGS
ncbi:hypothetical protein VULLAG_LOCUS3287 [Vulpes lagopus]